MFAEIASLPTEPVLPDGVRIEPVTDAAGVGLMVEAHDAAFGRPSPRMEQQTAAAGGRGSRVVDRAGRAGRGPAGVRVAAGASSGH